MGTVILEAIVRDYQHFTESVSLLYDRRATTPHEVLSGCQETALSGLAATGSSFPSQGLIVFIILLVKSIKVD